MRPPPLGNFIVPSSQLLKFLRAQNRGCANISNHAAHAPAQARPLGVPRSIATYTPSYPVLQCTVALESSTSFLETIWARRKPRILSAEVPSGSTPFYRSRCAVVLAHEQSHERKSTRIQVDAQSGSQISETLRTYLPSRWYKRSAQAAPPCPRFLSTTNSFSAERKGYSRFWGAKNIRPKTPLQPDDLPQQDDLHGFGGRVLRPANELKLRCTEFDEAGQVTLTDEEFKKSELIARYGLLPRDLRKIDSSLLPNILVRPSAILINLLHLRVLIKHNRVLVFDAWGSIDSYSQQLFMADLKLKLRSPSPATSPSSHSLPYEFRALEAVLISVTSGLEAEFEVVSQPVIRVLRELEEDIDRDSLRHLLIYSKKLGTFEQKARLVRDAIDDLLEADDDLADMYLTEKSSGVQRADDDHTEVEMLLESYHKVCDEIVQASGNLVSNIRNTEEIVKAILDANRNSLMLLDLKFSIGTLGLGGGTFVAALYGMNLKNFLEESGIGFWAVSAWCTIFSVIVCMFGLRRLRRVQRVSMWGGEGGEPVRGKSGWSREEAVADSGRRAGNGARASLSDGPRPLELEPLVGKKQKALSDRARPGLRNLALNEVGEKRELMPAVPAAPTKA